MQINFKINIETQMPDSEVEELLNKKNKKLSDLRKTLEYEMVKEISDWFIGNELINCKVKASFKKESDDTDKKDTN
jgi:hypothetical protein